MPGRRHKKYSRPRKLYDIALLKSETGLINKYGLKTRREVWRADFAIGKIRNLAKELITADDKKKKEFVERQQAKGFKVETIADVLGLGKEDYLKRRLQSIVMAKGLAKTPNQARQFIIHKHVSINGNIINAPSHLTTVEEEATVKLDITIPEKKAITDEEKELLSKLNHGNKK